MTAIRMIDGHPPVLRETTGERVRRLRLAKGWTQADLAISAGTTQTRVWRLEHGAEVFAYTLAAFAGALEICLCYLYAGGAGCEHADEEAS